MGIIASRQSTQHRDKIKMASGLPTPNAIATLGYLADIIPDTRLRNSRLSPALSYPALPAMQGMGLILFRPGPLPEKCHGISGIQLFGLRFAQNQLWRECERPVSHRTWNTQQVSERSVQVGLP
jgi:hypothetical protein